MAVHPFFGFPHHRDVSARSYVTPAPTRPGRRCGEAWCHIRPAPSVILVTDHLTEGDDSMSGNDYLAGLFEEQRPRLRSVAYRMLGSLSEADDAVQDAWLRVSRADTSDVANLRGYLTTVVARVCLNMLRARRSHPEEALEAHLPDFVVARADASIAPDPAQQ